MVGMRKRYVNAAGANFPSLDLKLVLIGVVDGVGGLEVADVVGLLGGADF